MQGPQRHVQVERLFSLIRVGDYAVLAVEAEIIATNAGRSPVERAISLAIWGYSLLRLDPHEHHRRASDLTKQAENLLENRRNEAPAMVDGALLTVGLSWQLVNKHDQAITVFDAILAQHDADLANKVKAGFSRAFSMDAMGRQDEELATYRELAQLLDTLPEAALTHSMCRDRNRVRLNLADYHLNLGQHEEAEAELNQLNAEHLTPLMLASTLVSQARIAMLRDQWTEAGTLANRAYTAALEANYVPLRVDALGVLVAVAARKNRRDEQLRLVVEMASLAQAK